jgi:hypothetical protein
VARDLARPQTDRAASFLVHDAGFVRNDANRGIEND